MRACVCLHKYFHACDHANMSICVNVGETWFVETLFCGKEILRNVSDLSYMQVLLSVFLPYI